MSDRRRRVVLVHGVGIGPWSFAALAGELAADHEVVVACRPGYGDLPDRRPPAASFAEQVEDLAGLAAGEPAAFVGVSGGATLVLALALAHPELLAAAVVHEPLVGPLAPELHATVTAAAARLAATPGEAAVVAFVEELVGPAAWRRLSAADQADVGRRQAVVRAEVPAFLAFAPTPAQLAGLTGMPLLSTVGGESPSIRRGAAAVVAGGMDISPLVLQGIGHLAQVEGPAALAGALRRLEHPTGGDEQVLTAGRSHELDADG